MIRYLPSMLLLLSLVGCRLAVSQETNRTDPVASLPTSTPVNKPTLVSVPTPRVLSPVFDQEVNSSAGTAYSLAFSPDGKTLAVGAGYLMVFFDTSFNQAAAEIDLGDIGIIGIAWRPAGQQFAIVSGFHQTKVRMFNWDQAQQTLDPEKELDGGMDLYGVSWSPDGKTLAVLGGEQETTLQVWDTAAWEIRQVIDLTDQNLRRALDWSADSEILYEAAESGEKLVLLGIDPQAGSVREMMDLPLTESAVVSVSPDGNQVAIADLAGRIRILSRDTGQVWAEFQAAPETVDIDWTPDGGRLAVLSYQAQLQVWEIQ